MKQLILLEKSDFELLKSGSTITIGVGGETVEIASASARASRSDAIGGYECKICGEEFPSPYRMYEHRREAHPDRRKAYNAKDAKPATKPGPTKDRPGLCPICGRDCTNAAGLSAHMKRHKEEKES